jgi:hypothetical protein
MSILNVKVDQAGMSGVSPKFIYIDTNNTVAEVTATGFLNSLSQKFGIPLAESDMALVTVKTSPSATSTQVALYELSKSGDNWSLVPSAGAGDVVLPTVANALSHFTNTTGKVSGDAADVVNLGDLTLGVSGTEGLLNLFPSTAASGSLVVKAVDSSSDVLVTISNADHGQASVYSIPAGGSATANIAVAPAALVSGNVVTASGTAGLLQDGGFAVLAHTTAAYGGGGTSNAFTATGIGATSIVTAVILASTNAVSIAKAVPTANTLTVTFSADPGASTTISYIAVTPAV